MQIGEILLQHGWVEWGQLALAVGDQADLAERSGRGGSRIRLCSLLVSRGVVDFDHAARALGEHFSCPAVLRRHLERRDRTLAGLLPPHTARRLIVLPIGRLASGALIVCARDPSPALQAALARALKQDVVVAVTPASYLERLVERSYPTDIDLPIDVTEPVSDVYDLSELGVEDADDDIADASELDIEDAGDLDEPDGAGDDIAIEIELPAEPATRAPTSRPLPVEIKPVQRPATEPARDSLDVTIASFPDIDDVEWLLDVVMGYVGKRWASALVLRVSDRRAVGVRGHGRKLKPAITRAFAMPLSEPSLVQLARDKRRVVDDPPFDSARSHADLVAALDNPVHPIAAPILDGTAVSHVLVVGDPYTGHNGDAIPDLEVLALAMSDALARM